VFNLEMSTPHTLIGIINVASPSAWWATYTLPTRVGVGHQRMESTSIGCNQWLSLAKITLKVPHAGRNRSLVANTNRCGEGISGVFFVGGGVASEPKIDMYVWASWGTCG
jgi:hypothetical protein